MSQIRGTLTLEISAERLAEIIALRVVAMLGGRPVGSDQYHRAEDPDPGAGSRRGVAPGHGVVNESCTDIDNHGEHPGRWT